MKAIVYHQYGTPDVLSLAEIPIPTPAAGEVLIKVRAASVNPYDWHFMRGTPVPFRVVSGFGKPRWPRLGADVAGVVEAVGAGVTRFKAGDALFGMARGAFAEYACGKETELAIKPELMPFDLAAAIPIAGVTALQGLRDSAKLLPEQDVLINGAAGGVGTFAVQIAKSMGARVTGVCSAANAELVLRLGADRVIDYTHQDFARGADHWDVVFDLVGNRSLADLRGALRKHGVLVSCGGGGPDRKSGELLAGMIRQMVTGPFVSQKLAGIFCKVNGNDLAALADLMAAGKMAPVLDRSYPLAETADAIRYVETGHAHGKVTIAVARAGSPAQSGRQARLARRMPS